MEVKEVRQEEEEGRKRCMKGERREEEKKRARERGRGRNTYTVYLLVGAAHHEEVLLVFIGVETHAVRGLLVGETRDTFTCSDGREEG